MAQDERTTYYAALCEQLYNPKSPQDRDQVQKMLEYSFPTFADEAGNGIDSGKPRPPGMEGCPTFAIATPTDTASALRVLLQSSPNPFVQTFCLSRLKQLITAQFSIFSGDTKLQLRTFLLEYAFLHTDLQPFVLSQLAAVFALLTRLGWLDMEDYRNVQQDINQFFQASVDHRIVGMQIIAVIVQDINAPSPPRNSAKFRKAAAGFRDNQLFDIFEAAFKTLEGLLHRTVPFEKPGQEERMRDATLNVLIKCLSYDFAGTSLDEAGEDIGTVQIPTSWRPIFEDENFVPTFFNAYREFSPPHSSKAIGCLVMVASTRKALFNGEAERSKFVVGMMQGIRDIILTAHGMNDADNYNEFCRLLYRFRNSAPLNEMVEKPGYIEWIERIAEFTSQALQSWKWAPNTASYLLGFWSRTVQSMTYYHQLGDATVQKLESIMVEITRTYISANVSSVPTRIEEMLDDPLESEETLAETLNMLGQIARCKYQESSACLVTVFDPIAVQYQELIAQAGSNITTGEFKEAFDVIETKFAWLVYIIALFVGNRPAYLSSDELDAIDGELTTKVLQLMDVNQALQAQHGSGVLNQKLDSAFIYFFQQFRKSYIGESTGKTVYNKLTEVFGISDQVLMLNVIMRKIIGNLQYWGDNEQVIRRTLELFNELASGYSALKNLRKIETTQLILQNHMSSEFAFLENEKHGQNRMLYYQVLCKILFAEDNCEREFYAFMKSFEIRLESLATLNSMDAFRQEPVRRALQDIFRDLRGFISPIQSRKNFSLFFDWFYPEYMPILLRALEAWSPSPVANTLLKFFAEFVHNKSQRLNFEVSSPNGILIFRDTSQIITTYGRHALEQQVTDESRKYMYKYKGISICFSILSRCLGGRYINFGIFWLYQDKAIDEVFNMMFQLMLSIPQDDLMSFPKLTRAFFSMLDDFTHEQLMAVPNLSPDTFLYLMQACEQGVESSESWIRSHACSTVNNIASYVIKEYEKAEIRNSSAAAPAARRRSSASTQPASHWLIGYLTQFPRVLPSLLTTLFNLILFDENNDQWSLSRPLYALMLLQKEYVVEYTTQVINQQLPERREYVAKALNNLLEGIGWTLCTKDRERFSQNISAFRRELSMNNVVLVPLSLAYT
ncbi:Exportin 7 [Apophysomyces sp. BC1034]|nr:Exportin 7 [Apophysomyces sp. BC1015]KAG0189207.1 Exportin 7 [Apophysomyces sp. BC1034]